MTTDNPMAAWKLISKRLIILNGNIFWRIPQNQYGPRFTSNGISSQKSGYSKFFDTLKSPRNHFAFCTMQSDKPLCSGPFKLISPSPAVFIFKFESVASGAEIASCIADKYS